MSWLNEYAEKYGDTIVNDGLGRRRIMKLTGLTEYKTRVLIKHLKNRDHHFSGEALETIEVEDGDTSYELEDDTQEVQWVHDSRYYYAQDSDTYVTFLSKSKQPLVVPGESHRKMKQRYSNWDGSPKSVNQICREFSIPRSWFVEYKSIHGWTHDSEPFSNEEIVTRERDDLVNDALQQRRRAVTQKYEIERWKEVQKQADKWLRFEVEVLERLVCTIKANAPQYTVPRIRLPRSEAKFAVVTCATDFHWGMYSWGEETGEEYDLNDLAHIDIDDEEEEEEVIEIEIDDITYYCTGEENGTIYSVDDDGEIGEEIGKINDGEATFY